MAIFMFPVGLRNSTQTLCGSAWQMRVKRRHGRSVITTWSIRYKARSGADAPGAYSDGRLVNVGKGGVCFETDRELVLGNQLDIELTSGGFPSPMLATGRVTWCRHSRVTAMFEVGVEFSETSWDTPLAPNP